MNKIDYTIKNKNIKALIFDLDGTLADTMPAHFKAWQQTAKQLNFEFTKKEFYDWAGMPATKIAKKLNNIKGYNLIPEVVLKKKLKNYINLLKDKKNLIKPIDIIKNVVIKYNKIIPMAIGTGNIKTISNLTLDSIGLRDYFKTIVTSDDVINHKPAPDTFIECANLLNIKNNECLVFEDGDLGIKAAKNAGMNVIDIRELI